MRHGRVWRSGGRGRRRHWSARRPGRRTASRRRAPASWRRCWRRKKLDAIAAKDPGAADAFVAALTFPGQLMVISARYSAPAAAQRAAGAPGVPRRLHRAQRRVGRWNRGCSSPTSAPTASRPKPAKRDDPIDVRDTAGKAFRFDGNWREDKMSEADYMKMYRTPTTTTRRWWRCCWPKRRSSRRASARRARRPRRDRRAEAGRPGQRGVAQSGRRLPPPPART